MKKKEEPKKFRIGNKNEKIFRTHNHNLENATITS